MQKRFFVAVALIVAVASPAYGATAGEITTEDVEVALDTRRQVSASLETVTARYEQAVVDETITRERIVSLSKSVSQLERDIGTKRFQVRELVVSRYMSGGYLGTERFFAARTFTDLPVQDRYSRLLNDRDLTLLRGLEIAEALHVEQQIELDRSLSEQVALVADIGQFAVEILASLERADAAYNSVAVAYDVQEEEKRRRAEEERLRREEQARRAAAEVARLATSTTTTTTSQDTTTTAPPSSTTTIGQETTTTTSPQSTTTTTTIPPTPPPVITEGKTCPINAATSFSDTWGAPRSGGRSHKGVDISAVRNAPVVAIESGTITRTTNNSLGGFSIYLTGTSGNRYYYAHLEAFAAGVGGTMAVTVGELIGYNGSSGNAPSWLPHVHFQYAPPGGDWVNPYPLVKALCG